MLAAGQLPSLKENGVHQRRTPFSFKQLFAEKMLRFKGRIYSNLFLMNTINADLQYIPLSSADQSLH